MENRTIVNGYFVLTEGGKKAVCTICGAFYRYHHSTSSLTYHLRHRHALTQLDISHLGKEDCESSSARTEVKAEAMMASASSVLNTMLSNNLRQDRHDTIIDKLCLWVAKDLRPLSIVEDKGFVDLMRVATDDDFTPPSSHFLRQRCTQLHDANQLTMKSILCNADFVALSVDHWTSSSNGSFIGTDACFVDGNWKLLGITLGVNFSSETHHSQQISNYLKSLVESWDIDDSKVNFIVTDSVKDLTNALNEDLVGKIQSPCMGHNLQCAIEKAAATSEINEVVMKVRLIVRYLKHSFVPDNIFLSQPHHSWIETLNEDVATRWYTTLDMISKLLQNYQAAIKNLPLNLKLSDEETMILEGYHSMLMTCEKISTMLGGEGYVPCSIILPMIYYFRKEMTTSENEPQYLQTFKEAFWEEFHGRVKSFEEKHHLYMATALDIRFKSLKCLPKEARVPVWEKIHAELLILEIPPQSESEPKPKRRKSILDYGDDDEDESGTSDKDLEHFIYRKTPEDPDCEPLNYWKAQSKIFPHLGRLAKKYLGIPATSIAVGRLFSLHGEMISQKKDALSPEDTSMFMSLHNWINL